MFSKVLNVICLPIETSIWRWEPICVIILDNSISLSEFWSTEIVINVQNVGKKWLGENFLFVHLLNGFVLSNLYGEIGKTMYLISIDFFLFNLNFPELNWSNICTFNFCVIKILLNVISSPGLDIQSIQGIHWRNRTCT